MYRAYVMNTCDCVYGEINKSLITPSKQISYTPQFINNIKEKWHFIKCMTMIWDENNLQNNLLTPFKNQVWIKLFLKKTG